jgi:hypothetical protein
MAPDSARRSCSGLGEGSESCARCSGGTVGGSSSACLFVGGGVGMAVEGGNGVVGGSGGIDSGGHWSSSLSIFCLCTHLPKDEQPQQLALHRGQHAAGACRTGCCEREESISRIERRSRHPLPKLLPADYHSLNKPTHADSFILLLTAVPLREAEGRGLLEHEALLVPPRQVVLRRRGGPQQLPSSSFRVRKGGGGYWVCVGGHTLS